MKTEQIIYLEDVSKTHSISQTANRFFISQQALNFSLTKLEEEFNTTLLVRTNKGVELTPEAIYFLEKSKQIIDIYRELKDEISLEKHCIDKPEILENDVLVIHSHTRVLEPILVNILQKYKRRYPQITIRLYEEENIEILNKVSIGDSNLGLVFVPETLFLENSAYTIPENIQLTQINTSQLVVCCSSNVSWKNSEKDFSNFPSVIFDTTADILFSYDIDTISVSADRYYSKNISFHKAMVRSGMAISYITEMEYKKLYRKKPNFVTLPLKTTPKLVVAFATATDKPISPATKLFIDMLAHYDFDNL